jgi:hypothetical protein
MEKFYSAFLNDQIIIFIFKKLETIINQTTYNKKSREKIRCASLQIYLSFEVHSLLHKKPEDRDHHVINRAFWKKNQVDEKNISRDVYTFILNGIGNAPEAPDKFSNSL